jgi:hypothetical protein
MPMELFTKLFGDLLVLVYHCFDRLVIHGYLSGLSRPEQVVYFFRQVLGLAAVDKDVLSSRTGDYQKWVEAFARMERELERAKVKFRKNDNAFLAVDDVAQLQAAADRLSPEIIRKRLDYWTLILGPKFSPKERQQMNLSRFYAIAQIEYCRNFIFKRNFPIHKIFERGCELGLWRLTAHKISEIFGVRLTRKMKAKLATVIDPVEHGHNVLRAYCKHAFLKQYEKFLTFLLNDICSNNLTDFGLKKGLDPLGAIRQRFQQITDRFATWQAQWLNVHVDFPLLQRVALPITVGAVLTTFQLSAARYGVNQLRYDLRKLKGHGLLERDGKRYAYRLTAKGLDVALLFLFFHKRLCGPLANSRFHHRPDAEHKPNSKLEAAYHKADRAIEEVINLLAA